MNNMRKVAALSLSLLVAAQVRASDTNQPTEVKDNVASQVVSQDTNQAPINEKEEKEKKPEEVKKPAENITEKSSEQSQQEQTTKPASEEKKRGVVAALVTIKSYTIDPVTRLVSRLMTAAKDSWNGYTAEQYKSVASMNVQDLSGLVTKGTFKDKTIESIRELAAKQEAFNADDIKKAQELLKAIEPGLLRKAVNKAKALVRIATFGFVFAENKDEGMAVLVLRNKVNETTLQEALAAQAQLKTLIEKQSEITSSIADAKKKVSTLKQLENVKNETIHAIAKLHKAQQTKEAGVSLKAEVAAVEAK